MSKPTTAVYIVIAACSLGMASFQPAESVAIDGAAAALSKASDPGAKAPPVPSAQESAVVAGRRTTA